MNTVIAVYASRELKRKLCKFCSSSLGELEKNSPTNRINQYFIMKSDNYLKFPSHFGYIY